MSVSEEEKRGKIILLVIHCEQSSTWTKILGVSKCILSCLPGFGANLFPGSSDRGEVGSEVPVLCWRSSKAHRGYPRQLKACALLLVAPRMSCKRLELHILRGQGLLLPGDGFRSFMEYLFLMIWLGSSCGLSLLHTRISWKCHVQLHRSFAVGWYGESVLVKQSAGCSSRLQIALVVES